LPKADCGAARRLVFTTAAVLLAAISCTSCNRDPESVRKGYIQRGNKYFDSGNYKAAVVMYRNVCSKDSAWGPGCYLLGRTELKLGQATDAALAFRNAISLLPPESPDHWAAMVELSDLYLAVAPIDKQAMDDVATYSGQLLDHDPQSFDGHRLTADLAYVRAYGQYQLGRREEWLKEVNAAIDEYSKANSIKSGHPATLMQLARAHAAKGDLAAAEAGYRAIVSQDKSFVPAWKEYYRLLMTQKKVADGEQLLEEASQKNPRRLELIAALAEHYLGRGNQSEMRRVIDQIGARAKDFERPWLTTGDLFLLAGDRDAAVREYRTGVAQDAKNGSMYQKRLVDVLLQQGKVDDAAGVNSQILKNNPKDFDARTMAAAFVLDKGDLAKAIPELEAVLKQSPGNSIAMFRLGQAYFRRGDVEQARKQFEESLKLHPNDVAARLALGELQLTRSEFDPALKSATQAVALDRSNTEGLLIAVSAYRGLHKFAEARNLLNIVLKTNPSSTNALLQLGELDLAEKKFPDANDAFGKVRLLDPANLRALTGIADCEIARKMPDKAIDLLQEEADKAPNRLDLRVALGGTAMRAGRYDIAIREFQKALAQSAPESKERGDIYLGIAESYRGKGDLNGAAQTLQEARKSQSRNVVVVGELAYVLDKAGRKPEAREAYEATLKLDPDNARVLNNLAFLQAETGGDLDDALSKVQRARQLQPDLDSALDTMGWIYLKKGIVDTSIRIFDGLVEKHNDHSTYHYHLAVALSQKNDRPHAIRELREALKFNPESAEKQNIQQLLVSLS
jgi:tetratricopeptide (TPR) repeat protein